MLLKQENITAIIISMNFIEIEEGDNLLNGSFHYKHLKRSVQTAFASFLSS